MFSLSYSFVQTRIMDAILCSGLSPITILSIWLSHLANERAMYSSEKSHHSLSIFCSKLTLYFCLSRGILCFSKTLVFFKWRVFRNQDLCAKSIFTGVSLFLVCFRRHKEETYVSLHKYMFAYIGLHFSLGYCLNSCNLSPRNLNFTPDIFCW